MEQASETKAEKEADIVQEAELEQGAEASAEGQPVKSSERAREAAVVGTGETSQNAGFAEEEAPVREGKSSHKLLNVLLGIVAVLLVAVAAFLAHGFLSGDIAPADAAAKYGGTNYLPESEVTDYIQLYREQMGLADASDKDWATFLAAYNLTPQRLRLSTMRQLIKDKLVEAKAAELGISASESEIDASIATLRDTVGLGDEEILRSTLQSHGQTEEGLREVYRQAIVKRLVLSAEVATPTPTDDQVRARIKALVLTLSSRTLRHTFCFRLSGRNEDANREKIAQVQKLRDSFAEGGKTSDEFATMVMMYADDDDLQETYGANGWDADTSGYSAAFLEVLEGMRAGDVSEVFADGDAYCFIWVNDEYTLPETDAGIDALTPDSMPESLWSYFSDLAGYSLWEQAGNDYIEQLLEDADVVYYVMPNDVPYNVDMSLADVQLEPVDGEEGSGSEQARDQADTQSSASSSDAS